MRVFEAHSSVLTISAFNASSSSSPCVFFLGSAMPVGTDRIAISAFNASSSSSPCVFFLGSAMPVGTDRIGACGTWAVGSQGRGPADLHPPLYRQHSKQSHCPPHAAISASNASSSSSSCVFFLGSAMPVGTADGIAISSNASSSSFPCLFFLGSAMPVGTAGGIGACDTWVVGTVAGGGQQHLINLCINSTEKITPPPSCSHLSF
eukprot:gene3757-13816_t